MPSEKEHAHKHTHTTCSHLVSVVFWKKKKCVNSMLASVDGTGFQIWNYTQATLCENRTPIPHQ